MLTSPVGHVGEREWVTLVLYRLPARSRDVVVIAHDAERIPAALRTAIRTNRRPAVCASIHGRLTARHPNVAVTRYELDLTVRFSLRLR
jgi:hypothetical protein